jgi:hypothetical protein
MILVHVIERRGRMDCSRFISTLIRVGHGLGSSTLFQVSRGCALLSFYASILSFSVRALNLEFTSDDRGLSD